MNLTIHAGQRMSQRGITRPMIDFVVEHGEPHQDRIIMSRKRCSAIIKELKNQLNVFRANRKPRPAKIGELQNQLRVSMKILDKGGCVVVRGGDAILTTYNY